MITEELNNEDLKQVEEFWNTHLCGKQFVDAKFPSKEFFELYRNFRYKKTHHLDTYIDWQGAKGKDVLEIGLGIGADGSRWAQNARTYTGVDLTAEAVYATKIHLDHLGLKGHIVQGNAEALVLPSNHFDIVYSHGVLHHTTNIENTFREVNRVLKPNGQFIVMLYSKGSFNYWFRIQFYFRLRLLFEILKNKLGGSSKGDMALHVKNFKEEGWKYVSWTNFPHRCTDGPDCKIANIYYQSEMIKMLEDNGFTIEKTKKAHFPIGGNFPSLEGSWQALWAFTNLSGPERDNLKTVSLLYNKLSMQLLVDIKDKTKESVLLNFLKSLNYISVEEVESNDVYLSDSQKEVLDERRNSAVAEEFIPWEKAKKQLKSKRT